MDQIKRIFLTSHRNVNTNLWMHYMDGDKMHKEKVRRELHRNDTSYIGQILDATHNETKAKRPFRAHL